MYDLEGGCCRGFAKVPRFARLVLLKSVEKSSYVHIVVVVKVAPPLLVRLQKVFKLLKLEILRMF